MKTNFILNSSLKADVLHGTIFVGILLNAREIFTVYGSDSGHFCQASTFLFVYSQALAVLKP